VQQLPAFGEQLRRLAEVRGLDRQTLARQASLTAAEITSTFDGAEPGMDVLVRLASVLGVHRSDLLVIAGREVPDHLAPRDATARGEMGWLAWSLTFLPRAVPELHELVRSLPRLPRPARPTVPTAHSDSYPNSPGGLVLRLLHNRNLDWIGAARYLYGLGGGPVLSASTIGMIGRGRKPLTPDLLAGFGAVLDIASADLSALTGIDASMSGARIHPDADEAAELIWSARELTAEQLRQVRNHAHDIRHERAAALDPRHRCSCTRRP
jgi:transcriptional regulator with XRE-family HTH domain